MIPKTENCNFSKDASSSYYKNTRAKAMSKGNVITRPRAFSLPLFFHNCGRLRRGSGKAGQPSSGNVERVTIRVPVV
jgi:hypothetical protein